MWVAFQTLLDFGEPPRMSRTEEGGAGASDHREVEVVLEGSALFVRGPLPAFSTLKQQRGVGVTMAVRRIVERKRRGS
jgi:hypothetical protein